MSIKLDASSGTLFAFRCINSLAVVGCLAKEEETGRVSYE